MSKPHYKSQTSTRSIPSKPTSKAEVAVATATPLESFGEAIENEFDTSNNEVQVNDIQTDIQLLAYLKWELAGKPEGNGINFWLEAEQELRSHQ